MREVWHNAFALCYGVEAGIQFSVCRRHNTAVKRYYFSPVRLAILVHLGCRKKYHTLGGL